MTGLDAAAGAGELLGPAGVRVQAGRHRARRIEQVRRHDESAEDAELTCALDRAREGDEASFTTIFRAVQPRLLRYLALLVGPDAEDVAAETWLQACRDLPRFRGDIDDFRAWTATIARHRALDHLRAARRRPTAALAEEEADSQEAAERIGDVVVDSVLESVSTARALAAIRALPRDQAEAVLLRAVVGLDAKTAAKILGKRAGAVRTAAYRGLQTLARSVDPAAERQSGSDVFRGADAEQVR